MSVRGTGHFFSCKTFVLKIFFTIIPSVSLIFFSQAIEGNEKQEEEIDTDDEDIEAQIQRELEGLQPNKDKKRRFQPLQMDMPCGKSAINSKIAIRLYARPSELRFIGTNPR
jgi:hypothetical protein